jgi:hypothetical protein
MPNYGSVWAEPDDPPDPGPLAAVRPAQDPLRAYRDAEAAGLGPAFLPPPPEED